MGGPRRHGAAECHRSQRDGCSRRLINHIIPPLHAQALGVQLVGGSTALQIVTGCEGMEALILLLTAFAVESSMVIDGADEDGYRARAHAAQPIRIGNHVLLPSGWHGAVAQTGWEVTIPLDAIVRYCAMTLIVVLAWPATGLGELGLRCFLSLPLLLPLVALPSLALSELWDQVQREMGIQRVIGWKVWSGALFDGGGLLLAGLLAGCAIAAARPTSSSAR
jgi:hypothetical protein